MNRLENEIRSNLLRFADENAPDAWLSLKSRLCRNPETKEKRASSRRLFLRKTAMGAASVALVAAVGVTAALLGMRFGVRHPAAANPSFPSAVSENSSSAIKNASTAETLKNGLRGLGFLFTEQTFASSGFFGDSKKEQLSIGRENVNLYTFSSEEKAARYASYFDAEGSLYSEPHNCKCIDWISMPHFYRSGALIVQYIGTNPYLTRALDAFLGKQFAGGDNAKSPSAEIIPAAENFSLDNFERGLIDHGFTVDYDAVSKAHGEIILTFGKETVTVEQYDTAEDAEREANKTAGAAGYYRQGKIIVRYGGSSAVLTAAIRDSMGNKLPDAA